MKKSILLGIVGLGLGMATSYGQGTVNFANYASSSSPAVYLTAGSVPVGGTYAAELGWYNGVATSTSEITMIASSLTYFGFDGPGANTDANGDTANGAGWYLGPLVDLSNYGWSSTQSGQTVTLDVFAFNNGSIGAATVLGSSGLFQVTETTGAGLFLPPAMAGTAGASFALSPVSSPEPSSLALAGLGGFGMLMAFRRKKA